MSGFAHWQILKRNCSNSSAVKFKSKTSTADYWIFRQLSAEKKSSSAGNRMKRTSSSGTIWMPAMPGASGSEQNQSSLRRGRPPDNVKGSMGYALFTFRISPFFFVFFAFFRGQLRFSRLLDKMGWIQSELDVAPIPLGCKNEQMNRNGWQRPTCPL